MYVSRYITASILHISAVLLLCTVSALPAPAQDQPSSPPGQPSKTVELGELGQQVRVSLKVGDRLRVVLRQLPRGFKWRIARNDNVILEATSSESTQPDGQGSVTGIQSMVFTAKSVGRDDLVLNYIHPFEREKPPLRTYTVAVTVSDAGAPQSAAVVPAGTLLGTYSSTVIRTPRGGKLPCADCRGIDTSIALYDAGSRQTNERYYVQTTTYFGTPTGDLVSVVGGIWLLKAYNSKTPDGSIYALESNDSDSVKVYRRQAALIALDSDGKPIQAPFNMNLQKQP
jgi:predicted secreted protein